MKDRVLIPNRGVIALDIIDSLKSINLETFIMHSPEDSFSLPVKLADASCKFYSSRLQDSYLDMEAIVEKALEIKATHVHPGYGFLAENASFAGLCRANGIDFIGPQTEVLALVEDKLQTRQLAAAAGIPVMPGTRPIRSVMDFNDEKTDFKYPLIFKPVKGFGGRGLTVADFPRDAADKIDHLLKREEYQKDGLIAEEFLPYARHIEVPFFRDRKKNILFLPEIESSVQRRFQKLFQESPSPSINQQAREKLYDHSRRLLEKIDYIGFGYVEFILHEKELLFLEINPTLQINTLIAEVHVISNFIKKQFAICRGESLHNVSGIHIHKPSYHILMVSLMAENPFNNFQPASGTVSDLFHYSTIRNIFKTVLYTGARISPVYDPFIGKILTFSVKRENAMNDMGNFLENILIRGLHTNLVFLKHLLQNPSLRSGDTMIDFINLKCEFSKRRKSEEELALAAALVAGGFHLDNRRLNYKAKLANMKQPGFFKRLLSNF